MIQILELFEDIFSKCVQWTGQLFSAIGGVGVVVAGFIIVLVVSLFLMPLRGGGVTTDGVYDFTQNVTHRPKYWNGKTTKLNSHGRRGKYEKRAHGGHSATPKY